MAEDSAPFGSLLASPVEILGRIMPASNHTYLVRLGDGEEAVRAVYKPVSGERPLWDFPDGTLAGREYAAYLVSESLGWRIVPETVLREGPMGPGMVQRWQEPDPAQEPVAVGPAGDLPPGHLLVVEASDEQGRRVWLTHEDSPQLRRMALFDIVVNNTDRKGGHVLAMADGHRYGVDHGVCFHTEDKLRTVLWGWAGTPLGEDEKAGLQRLALALAEGPGEEIAAYLDPGEIAALRTRLDALCRSGAFPQPGPGWPSLPWPAF